MFSWQALLSLTAKMFLFGFLPSALPSGPGHAVCGCLGGTPTCTLMPSDLVCIQNSLRGFGIYFFCLVKLHQAALAASTWHSSLVHTFSVSRPSLVEGGIAWQELREHKYLGL